MAEAISRPKAIRKGRLSLNAIPWARVYWKGKLLGETPLERLELPPGQHKLLLVNKVEGIRKSVPVRIQPGRTTEKLIDLKK